MATYQCQAIVIRSRCYGEADKILTIFSDHFGKISVLAKGVRRILSKMSGHLQLFSHSKFLLASGKTWDRIIGVEEIKNFSLPQDLHLTALGFYLAEAIDHLTQEGEENYSLYKLLNEVFEAMAGADQHLIQPYFELNLLKHLGYKPELYHCVVCGQKGQRGKILFSPSGGGLVCDSCLHRFKDVHPVSEDVIKLLRLYLEKKFSFLNHIKIKPLIKEEAEELSHQFILHIMEREPKSKKFLKKVSHD